MTKQIFILIAFVLGLNFTSAQNSAKIENLEFEDYKLEITFFDPYKNLLDENSDFNTIDSLKQGELWNNYLLHNVIYDFKLSQNGNVLKHYLLRGNPSKDVHSKNLTRNNIYLLDIVNHQEKIDYSKPETYSEFVDKTINKVTFYGTLFENMDLLKDDQEKIGKNLFGHFRMKIPYSTIRNKVMTLIGLDLYGEVQPEWIEKNISEYRNSFFRYQDCIEKYYKIERIKKTFVRTYEEDGSIKSEYPRLNTDEDISTYIGKMNRIGDVVTLPFFNSKDRPILVSKNDSSSIYQIEIKNNKPIEKYLENIEVTKNSDDKIDNITATLLIHGSSIKRGEYTDRENYIAYFKDFENCRLPYKILFSPKEDKDFQKPRIEIQLDYLIHKK